jgi:hypothetical protein
MRTSPKTLLLVGLIAVAVLCLVQVQRNRPFMGGSTGADIMIAPSMPGPEIAMQRDMASSYMGEDSVASAPMMAGRTSKMVANEAVVGGQMYIQDTSLSLVAKDPSAAEQQIRTVATELGGFLVSSTLSRPEEGATATVVVRVPTDKLDEALRRFEEAGQRVVHKSVQGDDVTQQYQDIEAKLATLNATQARLEELMDRATDASDLLQIQQQISSIQDQKDMYEGQRRYLTQAANLTRVSVFLASDELALPYVPAQPWQPEAVFKQAVRSLVFTLRGAGTLAIWAVVYLPLFIPLILLVWWINRRVSRS